MSRRVPPVRLLVLLAASICAAPGAASGASVAPSCPEQVLRWLQRCEHGRPFKLKALACNTSYFLVHIRTTDGTTQVVAVGPASPPQSGVIGPDQVRTVAYPGSPGTDGGQQLEAIRACVRRAPLTFSMRTAVEKRATWVPPPPSRPRTLHDAQPHLDPRWTEAGLALSALVAAWMLGASLAARRRRARRPLDGTALLCGIAVLGVGALRYGLWAERTGQLFNNDSVRDLLLSLQILRAHTPLPTGPWVSGLGFYLGPAYYQFMAVPLALGRSAAFLAGWTVCWQLVTLAVLYSTTRLLFDTAVAVIACALFLCSSAVHAVYLPITHSNYNFLLGLLAMRALYRFQAEGEPFQFVAVCFWTALAVQFHFTGTLLVAGAVGFALVLRGAEARPLHVLLGVAAALGPLLPTVPALHLRWANGLLWWWRLLGLQTALLPVALLGLLVAFPRRMTSRRGLAAGGLVLAGWAWWMYQVRRVSPDGPWALRLFNMALIPHRIGHGPGVPPALHRDFGDLLLSIARFGQSPALATLGPWLFFAALAVGAVLCLRDVLASGRPAPRRASGLLLGCWLLATAPVGTALWIRVLPTERYLSHAMVPLLVVAAVGVVAAGRFLLGSVEARLPHAGAGPVRALGLGAAILLPAALTGAGPSTPDPELLAPTARFLDACRDRLHLDRRGLATRVHGRIDDDEAFLDPRTGPSLFVAALDAPPPPNEHRPPAQPLDWRLVRNAGATNLPGDAVALPDFGLAAVPYRPALRTDRARLLERPPWMLEDSVFRLPYRDGTENYPRGVIPGLPLGNLLALSPAPNRPATALRIEIPRDPPADPALDGLEVLAGPSVSSASTDCDVTVSLDGTPATLRSTDGARLRSFRFALPAQRGPATVTVTLRGCDLSYLDVYDAPAGPATAMAQPR